MTATSHDEKIDINRSYRDVKAMDYSAQFACLYSEDFFYVFQSLSLRGLYDETIISILIT